MARIEGSDRWFISDNQFSAGFMDYVALIKPVHVGNGNLLRWELVFTKGTGYNKESEPIYCQTAEEAFGLVEEYSKQVMFDNLMDALYKDKNISLKIFEEN